MRYWHSREDCNRVPQAARENHMNEQMLQNRIRPNESESEISLGDLIAQLLARKWWIIAAALLGAMIGAINGQLPPNQFHADAVVQIEQRSSGVQLPSELIGDFLRGEDTRSRLDTEVHLIRSRLILQPVVEALSLDARADPVKAPIIGDVLARRSLPVLQGFIPARFARAGEGVRVSRLTLPDMMQGEVLRLVVGNGDRVTVVLPDGQQIEGDWTAPIRLPGDGVLEISDLRAAPGREYVIRHAAMRNVVRQISSGLAIQERGSSGIVDFRFSGGNPREAVAILNAVIDAYQEHNLRRRAAQIDRSLDFIEDQLPELRGELREARDALAAYRQDRDVRDLSVNTQQLLSQISEVEARVEQIGFEREQMLQRLTESHPDYVALQLEEDRLRARLDNLRESLADVPEAEQELARLTARVERARQIEQQLVNRVEQLRILRASTVGNIFVLEAAEIGRHVGPDRRTPIMIGFALGAVLSALGIFGVNYLRRGIEDAREIEELGLSLYATVNNVPQLRGAKASNPAYGMALHAPREMAVEALRGLRTGLRFSLAAAPSKSLLITSCAPSDGKSFIALNLAIVSGQTGVRVLLIDADMRRGSLRQYFGLKRKATGLSDLLSGAASFDEAIYSSEETGMDFMPTGAIPPNPAELLASDAMPEVLRRLNDAYDLIIVDASPVLAVSDAGIIGQHTGMSLLVVRHLVTAKAEIESVQKTLANVGVHLSGCVLNQFDQSASRYGSYGSKYGYYYGGYRYKYD